MGYCRALYVARGSSGSVRHLAGRLEKNWADCRPQVVSQRQLSDFFDTEERSVASDERIVHQLTGFICSTVMHNMNALFALTETAFMGGLKVYPQHFVFGPLVGCLYVMFSWAMVHRWNKREHGPQFIYFFFDTTLPGYTTTIALLILLSVLAAFYGIFCACDVILAALGSNVWTHSVFVAAICSVVMRFRD